MDFRGTASNILQVENSTLVLPAVSIGHVGQLCIDLLITSLGANRIGRLHHSALYPVVGVDAYKQENQTVVGTLQTSLEVYSCPDKQLVLLQQRSPCIPGCQREFSRDLVKWIKDCSFESVILLGSIDAQQRVDDELYGDQLRFACTVDASSAQSTLSKLGWKAASCSSGDKLHIPGSGLAKRLFTECSRENLSLSMALWFSLPGCQVHDAIQLAGRVNEWLHIVSDDNADGSGALRGHARSGWLYPSSWKVYMPQQSEQMLY